MPRKRPTVALIYDFDGTLSPGNMQEFGFIQAIGKSPSEFWTMSDEIAIGQDASNILSYMKLMFDEARKAGISLQREKFRSFGKSIELFDGVKEWFGLVNEYGRRHGVIVEHYINSSGLAEMIEPVHIQDKQRHPEHQGQQTGQREPVGGEQENPVPAHDLFRRR